jgi:hypothetical protein
MGAGPNTLGLPTVTPLGSSPAATALNGVQPVSPAAKSWIESSPCLCCGPVGRNGPIGSEYFLATGPSIPIGGGTLAQQINTGWMTEWGARALFFNRADNAAWTAKVALNYVYNDGSGKVPVFQYFGLPVRIRDLHRWSYTWGVGRDWFLLGNARPDCSGGPNLRFGADTGGRWGTSHVNLNLIINDPLAISNYLRRQDVFWAYYLGAHLDFEVPLGSWVWTTGLRAEYNFHFTDILPGGGNQLQDVNILLSTGFRY